MDGLRIAGTRYRRALRKGQLQAMRRHVFGNVPMVSWADGKVVEIPPSELRRMLEEAGVELFGGADLGGTETVACARMAPMKGAGEGRSLTLAVRMGCLVGVASCEVK